MDNKTTILEKSRELFERLGYHKTTLTDIARSVGKVKTAIYYYFTGKEEIFANLIQMEADAMLRKLQRAVEKEKDPIHQLEAYIDARMDFMLQLSDRYKHIKNELFELMPLIEANRHVAHLKEIALVEGVLKKCSEEAHVKVNAPDFAANMLVNSLKGLEIQMYVTDQIHTAAMDMHAFRHFLLYGIIDQTNAPSKTKKSKP